MDERAVERCIKEVEMKPGHAYKFRDYIRAEQLDYAVRAQQQATD